MSQDFQARMARIQEAQLEMIEQTLERHKRQKSPAFYAIAGFLGGGLILLGPVAIAHLMR